MIQINEEVRQTMMEYLDNMYLNDIEKISREELEMRFVSFNVFVSFVLASTCQSVDAAMIAVDEIETAIANTRDIIENDEQIAEYTKH